MRWCCNGALYLTTRICLASAPRRERFARSGSFARRCCSHRPRQHVSALQSDHRLFSNLEVPSSQVGNRYTTSSLRHASLHQLFSKKPLLELVYDGARHKSHFHVLLDPKITTDPVEGKIICQWRICSSSCLFVENLSDNSDT
jgi:hypothetical protein